VVPPAHAPRALIAAALFIGFGLFFAMLFVVLAGWWPRWVILGLGCIPLCMESDTRWMPGG
jgi:hypothetical protein